MKETIITIIIFCIAVVIVTAICTASFMLYLIGSRLFLFPSITPEMMAALVPAALTEMLLPGVLVALFVTLVRMRRKPGILFISYVVVGVLSFTVLFLGPRLIATTVTEQLQKIRGEAVVGLRDLEYPEKLITLKGSYLFFEKKEAARIDSLLIADMKDKPPRIRTVDRAIARTTEAGTVLVTAPSGTAIPVSPRAEEAGAFTPDQASRSLFDSFSALNRYFISLAARGDAEFLIVSVLLVFTVLSSSFFLRMTRWPLANIFNTLLVLFVILVFYNFLVFSLIGELQKITGESVILALIPNGMLAFASGLFFLLDFILMPEKRGKKQYA